MLYFPRGVKLLNGAAVTSQVAGKGAASESLAVSWSVSGRMLSGGESKRESDGLAAASLLLQLEIMLLCGRRWRADRRSLLFSSPQFFWRKNRALRGMGEVPPRQVPFACCPPRPQGIAFTSKLHLGCLTD